MGLNVKLDGADGSGDLGVGNDFRQIMLLKKIVFGEVNVLYLTTEFQLNMV